MPFTNTTAAKSVIIIIKFLTTTCLERFKQPLKIMQRVNTRMIEPLSEKCPCYTIFLVTNTTLTKYFLNADEIKQLTFQ